MNDIFETSLAAAVDRNIRKMAAGFRSILSEQDIDDIVQDACLKILLQKDKYRPDGNFEGWVYRICQNHMRSITPKYDSRLKMRFSYDDKNKKDFFGLDSDYSSVFGDTGSSPDTITIGRESERIILNKVDSMNEGERKLLNMMIDEQSRDRMREELDCTDGNLRIKILRARNKMRSFAIGA